VATGSAIILEHILSTAAAGCYCFRRILKRARHPIVSQGQQSLQGVLFVALIMEVVLVPLGSALWLRTEL
jgi:hypothetical protein